MKLSQSKSKFYYSTLDGWRAIAILMVMICHSSDRLLGLNGLWQNSFLHQLTRKGAFGVDLFFSISGFLITSRLIALHQETNQTNLKGFYIRRFFRILPPYFFFLFTLFILWWLSLAQISLKELLYSALFIRNYLPTINSFAFYTGHLWSIAIEEHFYLLLPSLLFILGPQKKRTIITLLIGCTFVAIWRFFDFRHQTFEHILPGVSFYTRTDIRIDGLLWGCVYALLIQTSTIREKAKIILSNYRWWAILIIWIFVIIAQPPLSLLWVPLISPLLIIGTVLNSNSSIAKILENRFLTYIGKISYSLYLWNSLFMIASDNTYLSYPLSLLQGFPTQWVLTFLLADFSYRFIEKPFINWGYRLAPAPKPER